MDIDREKKLRRNFKLTYWIQALSEMRLISVVSTLFMLSRGLTMTQIFLTAVVFSIVAIISELPSSYLADKWSRKGLMSIAIITAVIYTTFNMFAYGFVAFVIAIGIFSISYSFMSGTDEALLYDSARELGEEKSGVKFMGRFIAAGRVFKIVGPLLAVLIAANLTDGQFRIILGIDLLAGLVALFLIDLLVEPKHFQRGEKIAKGVLRDSLQLFKDNPTLIRVTINRTLIFLASFMLWRVSSVYFTNMGMAVLWIGLMATFYHGIIFILNMKSHQWWRWWSSETIIKVANWGCVFFLGLFWLNEVSVKNILVAMGAYIMLVICENVRYPYFSDIINKYSNSYNRATTISGSSLITELLKFPLLLIFAYMVNYGYGVFVGLLLGLAISTEIFFSLKEKNNQ
ncbi:MAG: MFS transporter [Microgenomates group bacterium]